MPIEFQSLGAVQEVTGSCHLIRVGERRVLLDCGMFQGGRNNAQHNRDPFPFDPATIDAVILSHAHIDHSGRIPILVSSGFRGPVYTHPATKDLTRILLKDSAFLHEKETGWENRKRERKGLPLVEPLYTQQDAAAAMRRFKVLHYAKPTEILPGVIVCLHDAGHILGSAIVELK
ncbi:MAG: MBL fold metallo-hydrolase, partial [Pseudomonadales bacterium]